MISSPTGTRTEPPLPPRPLYEPGTIKRCSSHCASLTRIRLACANRAPVAARHTTRRYRSPSNPCSSSMSRAARSKVPIWASVRIWLPRATDISSSSSIRSALNPSFTIEGNVGFSFLFRRHAGPCCIQRRFQVVYEPLLCRGLQFYRKVPPPREEVIFL